MGLRPFLTAPTAGLGRKEGDFRDGPSSLPQFTKTAGPRHRRRQGGRPRRRWAPTAPYKRYVSILLPPDDLHPRLRPGAGPRDQLVTGTTKDIEPGEGGKGRDGRRRWGRPDGRPVTPAGRESTSPSTSLSPGLSDFQFSLSLPKGLSVSSPRQPSRWGRVSSPRKRFQCVVLWSLNPVSRPRPEKSRVLRSDVEGVCRPSSVTVSRPFETWCPLGEGCLPFRGGGVT